MTELYASVDLGGTTIACALADREGKVAAEGTIATEGYAGPQGVLERMARVINDLAGQAGCKPSGVGVVVPGLADVKNGVTKFLPNMPGKWRDVAVRQILEPLVGCPVYLLNDARAAALGEMTFGHGRSVRSMVFFTLGTGIGGGIVIDGRLLLGPLGAAGEIGHMTIIPDGPSCGCGSRGCLETLFSGPALTGEGVRLVRSGQAPKLYEMVGGDCGKVTPKEMGLAAAAGDAMLREVIVRHAEYLGIGVANLVTSLDPDLVVLGGGVAEMGALLFDTVRETVKKRVVMVPTERLRIERSMVGERAGMLGGVALAMKRGLVDQ
jgi:glucokinase